jgi:TraX protein
MPIPDLPPSRHPRRFEVADGTLEALKWLALFLMVADHTNKYLLHDASHTLFNIGRIAMPLFVFVLAYNLARPGSYERGTHVRTMNRLIIFGILATPPFIALGGLLAGWWPLNILFTLLSMTAIIYCIEQRSFSGYAIACAAFIVGGSSVEFWWPALVFGIAIWWYCKMPSIAVFIIAVLALASLRIINGNYWAIAAIPILLISCAINIPLPRYQWVFYYFYPIHLSILWLSTIFTCIVQ